MHDAHSAKIVIYTDKKLSLVWVQDFTYYESRCRSQSILCGVHAGVCVEQIEE